MKKFIIVQMQIDNEINTPNDKNIIMSNVVRVVEAESKETAIGKFVISTRHIRAHNKKDIECYDLSELLLIK